jgi:hypothetical protein
MSTSLHITREPGTTGASPEDFTQFCLLQVLRFEPGNDTWYGRFTEVCYVGGETNKVTFSTIWLKEKDAIPEVCELATAFWTQLSGKLSGDDRCLHYITRVLREQPATELGMVLEELPEPEFYPGREYGDELIREQLAAEQEFPG